MHIHRVAFVFDCVPFRHGRGSLGTFVFCMKRGNRFEAWHAGVRKSRLLASRHVVKRTRNVSNASICGFYADGNNTCLSPKKRRKKKRI